MNFDFSATVTPRKEERNIYEARSSSPPMSSPTDSTRRFAQYKPRISGTSIAPSHHRRSTSSSSQLASSGGLSAKDLQKQQGFQFQTAEPPQRALWRDKLRLQVEKRAKRDRERMYERGRSEEASSEGGGEGDIDMEDENMDDLDDELYRRIMLEERRKLYHQSKINYEQQFGDSDDVHMGDVDALEEEFTAPLGPDTLSQLAPPLLEDEEKVAQLYEAYMEELQTQEQNTVFERQSSPTKTHQSDEFDDEFDDIDPQILSSILGSR
ncbi:hypothetical protein FRC15_004798 [Serendipita sp. 397]|nr:hypothetical protein FRC15_004798 [Serendipita sp. 397]